MSINEMEKIEEKMRSLQTKIIKIKDKLEKYSWKHQVLEKIKETCRWSSVRVVVQTKDRFLYDSQWKEQFIVTGFSEMKSFFTKFMIKYPGLVSLNPKEGE